MIWASIFATLALVLSLSTLAFTLSPGDLTVPSCFQGDTTWDQDNIYRSSNSPIWILQIKNLSCNVYSYSVLVDFDSPEKCQETCQADPACVGFTLVQCFTNNSFNHPVLNWLLNYQFQLQRIFIKFGEKKNQGGRQKTPMSSHLRASFSPVLDNSHPAKTVSQVSPWLEFSWV